VTSDSQAPRPCGAGISTADERRSDPAVSSNSPDSTKSCVMGRYIWVDNPRPVDTQCIYPEATPEGAVLYAGIGTDGMELKRSCRHLHNPNPVASPMTKVSPDDLVGNHGSRVTRFHFCTPDFH
jgi:hypothetical protein